MITNKLETAYGKFYLEQFLNEITLMFEDKEGYPWYICSLKENKPMKLHSALPEGMGILVDEDGNVETDKEK